MVSHILQVVTPCRSRSTTNISSICIAWCKTQCHDGVLAFVALGYSVLRRDHRTMHSSALVLLLITSAVIKVLAIGQNYRHVQYLSISRV